jgi:ubiquinone/menaquinone biosynthesis C-methylase UbiE
MGGRVVTIELGKRLNLTPDMHLLDIGCGIGGAARYLAWAYGCRAKGLDVTKEFVEVATTLTRLVGLADRLSYVYGSALDLPFEAASFDAATLLHVGMNIEDKARLFEEAHRVIRPGGTFAVYDVMRAGEGALAFPVAWANVPERSHLASQEDYRGKLGAAGFDVVSETNQREIGMDTFRRMLAGVAEKGPPPLGLHILMGKEALDKVANMLANLESGRIAPIEMICRRL